MGGFVSKCCDKVNDQANINFQENRRNKAVQGKIDLNKDENRDEINDYLFQKTKATASIIKEDFLKSEKKPIVKTNSNHILENFATKLSSIFRGIIFRSKFENKIKQNLLDESQAFITKILEGYNLNTLEKAEKNRTKQFSLSGYREFYSEDSEFINFNYGNTYFTRIFSNNFTEFFTGQVNNENQKQGYGTLITSEGEKYQGYFFKNEKSGWGELIDKDSNIFQGLFINDSLTGKGEKFALNGDYYKGDFNCFQKHGEGFEDTKSFKYWGNYLKDKKNLKGKIEYKQNKDVYEGEFRDDAITGIGTYKWKNRDVFEGSFVDGKMHGKGKYKWPDGALYEGNYVENIKIGEGKFKWSNGKVYIGPFVNGKQHGAGKIVYPDGRVKQVVFENGKLKNS